MNRPDLNIDELLNSFIDGELTADEQIEVRRLIAHDEQIARRLKQLQKTKMLVSCLPGVEAPAEMVEQVMASLERKTLLDQQPVHFDKREGARQLLVRRVLAAAAMITLVAVLAGVVYTIVAPETVPVKPAPPFVAMELTPSATSEMRFTGRLGLTTHTLTEVDAFIGRTINDNGLSDYVGITREPNKSLYSLTCSRQALHLLLADLQSIWQKFDSATLFVDTEQFAAPVVVDAITLEQTAEIVGQDSSRRSIEVAEDFAVLNSMANLMPGTQIASAIGDRKIDLITAPKPVLTWAQKTVNKTASGPKEVSLIIQVVGSE